MLSCLSCLPDTSGTRPSSNGAGTREMRPSAASAKGAADPATDIRPFGAQCWDLNGESVSVGFLV